MAAALLLFVVTCCHDSLSCCRLGGILRSENRVLIFETRNHLKGAQPSQLTISRSTIVDVIGEIISFGEVETLKRDGVSRKFKNLKPEDHDTAVITIASDNKNSSPTVAASDLKQQPEQQSPWYQPK
ncbi:hypothetical protein RND71_034564 [Anisodus tanguticus]|uniref:Uncharacterized protein n=1 Tax=Anisodus tanguticus TaxID=243964 RepID=A0AAE1RAU0_9SOLA|nr:hypothetical protein RND71_034564 [Anisodus tanguticus]